MIIIVIILSSHNTGHKHLKTGKYFDYLFPIHFLQNHDRLCHVALECPGADHQSMGGIVRVLRSISLLLLDSVARVWNPVKDLGSSRYDLIIDIYADQ